MSPEQFYDQFAKRLVSDYVYGNLRVKKQLQFFKEVIPSQITSVLIIGCGSGESADFISARVARHAQVVGLDLSSENIRVAKSLFSRPQVSFRKMDFINEDMDSQWDAIALPDVYEHFPKESRPEVHARLNALLKPQGKVLLTIPTPAHQEFLKKSGEGLQPVDEIVNLEDLRKLAQDLNGELTMYRMISVWRTHDYCHAVIERGSPTMQSLAGLQLQRPNLFVKVWRKIRSRWLLKKLTRSPGVT